MASDGESIFISVGRMLSYHGISRKEYGFWRRKYPKLNREDLLNLIKQKKR